MGAKISTSTFLGALLVHETGKIDSEAIAKDAYRRGGEGGVARHDLNSMAMAGETAGAV